MFLLFLFMSLNLSVLCKKRPSLNVQELSLAVVAGVRRKRRLALLVQLIGKTDSAMSVDAQSLFLCAFVFAKL